MYSVNVDEGIDYWAKGVKISEKIKCTNLQTSQHALLGKSWLKYHSTFAFVLQIMIQEHNSGKSVLIWAAPTNITVRTE